MRTFIAFLLLGILLFFLAESVFAYTPGKEKAKELDQRTIELCRWYATLDHEKEIAPARYKWLTKEYVDSYDWFDSCINHVKYPVAQ